MQNAPLVLRSAAENAMAIAILDGSNDGTGAASVESGGRIIVTVLSKRMRETATPSDVEGGWGFWISVLLSDRVGGWGGDEGWRGEVE
ncbi:hypothetical protein EYC80_010476 [Monilinia laxa]|uniref:Uncharacterized protein n=1 Tax=Monilinia laxa TaxID=61186 RepID=A0A5N6JR07_MONLA|nr:hypothetical protein EYC80_010476 [Monilinia laxa]